MARGQHIFVQTQFRGLPFQHHGIDMGDGTVIHLAPTRGARVTLHDDSDEFSVRRVSMEEFCVGQVPQKVEHLDERDPETIAQAAAASLGRSGYSLLDGNCEHFACECATGRAESRQIEMGEATVSSMASMATKMFWSVSSKYCGRWLTKSAMRAHPAMLLADGVEVATLAAGCRSGLSATRSRRLAKMSGTAAAAGIGTAMGGPAGAVACVAVHVGSSHVAEQICTTARKWLSKSYGMLK
jgi:hypothetical protein